MSVRPRASLPMSEVSWLGRAPPSPQAPKPSSACLPEPSGGWP
jgi:hypothetical protein